MLSLCGAVMIGCGFACGGFALTAVQRRRVETLRALLLMLTLIEGRLRYLNAPVGSLISVLAGDASLAPLQLPALCDARMQAGETFQTAWAEAVRADSALHGLPETAALLQALGSTLGAMDAEGQLNHCAQCKTQLELQLQEARAHLAHRAGLFPPLGLLLGVFTLLMLIHE